MIPQTKLYGGTWLIALFFVLTLTFVGGVLYIDTGVRHTYLSSVTRSIHTLTFGFFDKKIPSEDMDTETPSPSAQSEALITEFGTTTTITIIDASSTASTTDLIPPRQIEIDELSPESAWAKTYLTMLGYKQKDLKLDIRYVKEWQQSGGLTRDLRTGSKGTDVKLMQYLLSIFDPSFNISQVSGTFGAQTKASITNIQKNLGHVQTGVFNEELRFFFDSVYFKELCPDALPTQDKSLENISRRTSVPLDYIPADLIRVPRTIRTIGVMCLSKEPAMRLEALFKAAQAEQHELAVFSAYRSANTQKLLTAHYLQTLGEKGLEGVAEAGHSEHQLGTTVDISGKSIKYVGPSAKFGTTKEGRWLAENSYKYGFIMSYPENKKDTTGYIYEPWHFRYVGIDTARDIYQEKLTIQEYLNLVKGESFSPDELLEIPE